MTKCGLSQASQHSKIDQCNLPYEKTREEKVHGCQGCGSRGWMKKGKEIKKYKLPVKKLVTRI